MSSTHTHTHKKDTVKGVFMGSAKLTFVLYCKRLEVVVATNCVFKG